MAKRYGDSAAWQHLYKRARWLRMRERQLMQEPLCRFCIELEDVTPATVVDHVMEHKGDEAVFFDAGNLQSLCKRCHDSIKQRMERGQTVVRFGPDGWPI